MSSVFAPAELDYLRRPDPGLARLATVGPGGMPHVVPTGWRYSAELDTIDIGGASLQATKKYRDVVRHGLVALVIDDVVPPWQPRGIEVRGAAEALATEGLIRVHPQRIVSWGLLSERIGERHARTVSGAWNR